MFKAVLISQTDEAGSVYALPEPGETASPEAGGMTAKAG